MEWNQCHAIIYFKKSTISWILWWMYIKKLHYSICSIIQERSLLISPFTFLEISECDGVNSGLKGWIPCGSLNAFIIVFYAPHNFLPGSRNAAWFPPTTSRPPFLPEQLAPGEKKIGPVKTLICIRSWMRVLSSVQGEESLGNPLGQWQFPCTSAVPGITIGILIPAIPGTREMRQQR